MNTRDSIERFILDELVPGGTRSSIDPDEPLVSGGILDSLGLLRLMTFLEEQFGLTVGDGEVGSENFETLAKISSFVERKRLEVGAGRVT